MKEKTLVLIKPDAVERNIIGNILTEYERNGLAVLSMKMMNATEEIAAQHYAEHAEKDFFPALVAYITGGPLVALIIEGENAVTRVRALNGSTNPENAADNTIRALYGLSKSKNTVHASDSAASAEREIGIWFGEQ